mmetsp:Transcript_12934/g.17413  ORF Transcript_12934/g.17413 Transcript_12934/m.17413 type:complete len:105 (+) Transcript_12934:590-904(+)
MSKLPKKFFGEGLAPRSKTQFALLTYKHRRIFIVDKDSMQLVGGQTFVVPKVMKEGWGFTADESKVNAQSFHTMYASDGTQHIYELDGETLMVQRTITVKDDRD